MRNEPEIINSLCNSHCGGQCLLKIHVRHGKVMRIETDDGVEPQLRACLRGRAYRQRVYSPDRLEYPLRRDGPRGEGRFQRISWEEALVSVASQLQRVRDSYGPPAIVFGPCSGDLDTFHHGPWIERVLNRMGGFTETWGTFSFEGGVFASLATYGTDRGTNHTRDDLLDARLIIMWGWDPATTIQSTNTCWYLSRAHEKGARIVAVDPRMNATAAIFADEWIPIRPGTDAAALIAMAYVMIIENLHDRAFLDSYTIGFEKFQDYVLGQEDGVPKTPSWAAAITGVPEKVIYDLARQYATSKPAALICGIAPGRTAFGEQYHRVAMVLSAMTGNVGIHGGEAATRCFGSEYYGDDSKAIGSVRRQIRETNPADPNAPSRPRTLAAHGKGSNSSARINIHQLADAVLKGRAGGYRADYKLLFLMNCNYLNQVCDIGKTIAAFNALDFVVVQEQFMTATAKYADIVLPVNTFFERDDVAAGGGGSFPYYGCINKAIESQHESWSQFEIATGLATKLGILDFTDKDEKEWLEQIRQGFKSVTDIEVWKHNGVHKVGEVEPYVAFEKQIQDLANNPFPTPSGKIEIYSEQFAQMKDPLLPPVPMYIETWESRNDPLSRNYPLQLITTHCRRRAHSQFDNLPWLRELEEQAISVNPVDASARGITDGETVKVFNDRGATIIKARVTNRIMPGVVDIPQGAWFKPDKHGIDVSGNCNVLTKAAISPGGAMCTNTCLVEISKHDNKGREPPTNTEYAGEQGNKSN